MEKPELIEQKIEELKKQLSESKKHYQFELVCTSNFSDEMIGFFNIGNVPENEWVNYENDDDDTET